MEIVVADNDGKNRHGYPRGYHFVPKKIELIRLLEDKIAGRHLKPPFPNIFHDVRILDFHPDELYELYKEHEEAGHIYFFSRREYPTPRGDRARPVRVANGGGNWKASGGSKTVRTMKRGGVIVGYELTMVFYDKKKSAADTGKTNWGMHEYTKITGPNKKVADLALYSLYQKKKKNKEEEAGKQVAALSKGSLKLRKLPSPPPMGEGTSMASTSQAHAQANVGQPHDCYHQGAFGAAASLPGPSSWATPTAAEPPMQVHAGYMGLTSSPPGSLMVLLMAPSLQASAAPMSQQQQQQAVDDVDLAGYDNMMTESGPAAVAHDLKPSTHQQDAEYPGPADSKEQLLKMLQPPSLQQQPTVGGYLDDEFKVWCETQQEQTAASPCWFPMPGDDDLPMLTDVENDRYACTMDELLADLHDDVDMSMEEADANHEDKSSKSNQ